MNHYRLRFSYTLSADCHGRRPKPENCFWSGGWTHQSGEAHTFYEICRDRCAWVSKPPVQFTGSSVCSQNSGHELWIGDSAKIRASEVRKQKTDERDARLILDLMLAKRFPKSWVPTPGNATSANFFGTVTSWCVCAPRWATQLHALAMSQGLCRKKKLFHQRKAAGNSPV